MKRTRIKICGLTRTEDVCGAVEAGADALGFVFYPGSSRYVSVERAQALVKGLPPFVTPVGLFVNPTQHEVEQALEVIPHLVLQFHGDESATVCEHFQRPYIRAVRVQSSTNLLEQCDHFMQAQALLLDTHTQGYGGSGQCFDWTLVKQPLPKRLVLSGGLTPSNVAEGIRQIQPWAVDVSSGVEQSKGIKDLHAMNEFCQAVRDADHFLWGAE